MRRVSSLADVASEIRIPVLLAFVIGISVMDSFDKASLQDPFAFANAGLQLFSRHWLNVFSDSTIQVGPLQLAFSGAVALVARWADIDLRLPLSLATELLVTFGTVAVTRSVMKRAGTTSRFAELVAGAAVILFSIGYRAFTSGHTSEALIPALWVLAAGAAVDSRFIRAGLLIGLSAGLKPWGVLGIPLLLLSPHLKETSKALLVSGSTIAACYVPFIAFGEFNMQHFRWLLDPGSPLKWLYGSSIGFTWQMRMVQAALVVGVSLIGIRLFRGTLQAVWMVPLVTVATKVLLDPVRWYWYWIPIQLLCVWGGCMYATRADLGRSRWVLIGAMALPVILPTGGMLLALWVLGTVFAGVAFRAKLHDKHLESLDQGSYSLSTE